MSASVEAAPRTAALSIEDVRQFLFREARALDDKQWDDWLAFYAPEASFWMPAWDDDDTLVEDPAREISLIYYPDKSGLEDRVFRIRTERSSATSLPEDGMECRLRFNWFTLNFRYKTVDTYFGTSFYTLKLGGAGGPLIADKRVVLKNDYIHHVIDVYHI